MTMKWLTILQFLEIVAAYGIVTLFLPWLVLRKRFRRFSAAEQLTGYFFAWEILYHLSGISAAVSSYQQSCDTDGRHRGAVSSGVDLEKKK